MSERDAVLFANTAFYTAFTTRDYAAMEEVWAQGDVGCVHPGWPPLKGRTAVMASWRNILANPGSPQVASRDAAVLMHGALAIVMCLEVVSEREGANPQALSATNIFVKEGPVWKIVHHHAGAANIDVRKLAEETKPPLN